MQYALKLVTILLLAMVRNADDTVSRELVDTMKMPDAEVDLILPGYQPTEESDEEDALAVEPEDPYRTTLPGLISLHLNSCLARKSETQPVGMQVARDQVTNDPSKMSLNLSEIFRDMELWNITTYKHPIGMLYISGGADENEYANMLPIEDMDDAIGLAVMPGYGMMNKRHLNSLWDFIQFLNLAQDNVWSQKLHPDNHFALWDNIFRMFIKVCSGSGVEIPKCHKDTCSCYAMAPRILALCELVKLHPEEEAKMANNPVQRLQAILDKSEHKDYELHTRHLCPVLFRLLPILGIKTVHIEKCFVDYNGLSDSIMDAKIETLSFEDGSCWKVRSLLKRLDRRDANGQYFWKTLKSLKAPGWSIFSSDVVKMANNLQLLENIESAEVVIRNSAKDVMNLFCNPRASSLLSDCVIVWFVDETYLSENQPLQDGIKGAKVEHLAFHSKSLVKVIVNYPNIWQNLRTVRWPPRLVDFDPNMIMKLLTNIPSLKRLEYENLFVIYDGMPMDTLANKIPQNAISVSQLFITGRNGLVVPEALLELLWWVLTDTLSILSISGESVESLPAPKFMPAFANAFRILDITDLHCLSTDMCSHLGAIGGGVEKIILYRTQYQSPLVHEQSKKLAALFGALGRATPLGKSVTCVILYCEASDSLDLEPLLHCGKLATTELHLRGIVEGKSSSDKAIARVAAEINKFEKGANEMKFRLHLSGLGGDELRKLLHQICPGSDPTRVISYITTTPIKINEFTGELNDELERYRSGCETAIPMHP